MGPSIVILAPAQGPWGESLNKIKADGPLWARAVFMINSQYKPVSIQHLNPTLHTNSQEALPARASTLCSLLKLQANPNRQEKITS